MIGVSPRDAFIEKTNLVFQSALGIHKVNRKGIIVIKSLDIFILGNEYEFRKIRIENLVSVNVERINDQGVERRQEKLVILIQKFRKVPVVYFIDGTRQDGNVNSPRTIFQAGQPSSEITCLFHGDRNRVLFLLFPCLFEHANELFFYFRFIMKRTDQDIGSDDVERLCSFGKPSKGRIIKENAGICQEKAHFIASLKGGSPLLPLESREKVHGYSFPST